MVDQRDRSIGEKQDPVKDNGAFLLPEDFFLRPAAQSGAGRLKEE